MPPVQVEKDSRSFVPQVQVGIDTGGHGKDHHFWSSGSVSTLDNSRTCGLAHDRRTTQRSKRSLRVLLSFSSILLPGTMPLGGHSPPIYLYLGGLQPPKRAVRMGPDMPCIMSVNLLAKLVNVLCSKPLTN